MLCSGDALNFAFDARKRPMPDRISPSSSLAETLRALTRDRVRDASGRKAADKTDRDERAHVETQRGIEPLRQRLRELAKGVDVDDPRGTDSIRNNALREILLWEFGGDFRNDAQFQPMLDALGKAMDTDAGYRQQFAQLLAALRHP